MTPRGSLHASTVDILSYLLVLAVGKAAIVRSQNPITLDKHCENEVTEARSADNPQAMD
jgi:hypothetical protein